MRLLGREPAALLALFATAVRLVAAFWIDLTDEQQAILNAVATALVGLLIAAVVRRDGLIAAILGFVQALLALAIGFGLDLSAESQAVIMSFVGATAAMFVRTQVVAPTPPAEIHSS